MPTQGPLTYQQRHLQRPTLNQPLPRSSWDKCLASMRAHQIRPFLQQKQRLNGATTRSEFSFRALRFTQS